MLSNSHSSDNSNNPKTCNKNRNNIRNDTGKIIASIVIVVIKNVVILDIVVAIAAIVIMKSKPRALNPRFQASRIRT